MKIKIIMYAVFVVAASIAKLVHADIACIISCVVAGLYFKDILEG